MHIPHPITKALASTKGRILAGIAFVGAVINGIPLGNFGEFSLPKAALIFTAALTWIFAEISDQKIPSPADIELFKRICDSFDQSLLDFLKDHDFKSSFKSEETYPIGYIAHMHGPYDTFSDIIIQEHWNKIKIKAKALSILISYNANSTHRGDRLSIIPQDFDEWQVNKDVYEKIKTINEGCTDLYDSFTSFSLLCRSRLAL
ncbi:hypothetical protein GTZ99_09990 [Novosphingobium sp. FSY-8]|uniref:SMODS and SLOG-associating 2TM effector domain-containing protein n=1 Tax=Novosphingobium ovatum TaxID=1908523 RepID=A0ABW9XEL6_9SPHN|nr:hypothetical protein [Novosphingobium ovatum]NBC36887.1 hypothetical protein [Novosphingobium ovatum]